MGFATTVQLVSAASLRTGPDEHSVSNTIMSTTPDQNAVDAECMTLMEAIKKQDEAALAQLYDLTVERVYALALAMTGNAQDAEDVVSDVYLKVWQRALQYQAERGRVIGWLLVTCRSAALDLLRRRRRRAAREQPQAELPETGSGFSPEVGPEAGPEAGSEITAETLLNTLQEGTLVHAALAELSAVQRRLIGLAFFHDMSHREIAACVQMPIGTVKSHIRRGLQSLRHVIELQVNDER